MYTQCSHCRAVFRVTMKELTAAQGLLRCGECDTIFDAMKGLSTTLSEERSFTASSVAQGSNRSSTTTAPPGEKTIRVLSASENTKQAGRRQNAGAGRKKTSHSRKFLYLSLLALGLLLLLQLAYSARNWLREQPGTTRLAQNICLLVGCDTEVRRDIKNIKMLSHNVYSHPNSPNVLIISTSIQNNAPFEQPYPLLEISFLNTASEVVALRRFTPTEYLGSEQADALMPLNTPKEFSVNIADPGKDAVRFQFNFL